MRRIFQLFVCIFALFGAPIVQADEFQNRLDTSSRLPTVGHLMLGPEGSCAATLIASDLILTSAHCVTQTGGWENLASISIQFRYFPNDGSAARIVEVSGGEFHPYYTQRGDNWHQIAAHNLALFRLEWPISGLRATPARFAQTIPNGGQVALVDPPSERGDRLSVGHVCTLTSLRGAEVAMECPPQVEASPLPVFRFENGALRLVTVTSALIEGNGELTVIGMDLDKVGFVRGMLPNWSNGILSPYYRRWPDQAARSSWP